MTSSPAWHTTLLREAKIRSGLVLYGNTRDLFWAEGHQYCTLPTLLARSLANFTIQATWDVVDGLRFADDTHARRWDRIVSQGASAPVPPLGASVYRVPAAPAPASAPIDLDELIARYRLVLAEPGERPLLIVDWSHLLVTQPAHPDAGERRWLLRLGKALVGEPLQPLDSDHLRGDGGLLVLLSAHLAAVPPVLYQGEPRIRLLSIPPPGREERRAFFDRHFDDIRLAAPRAAPGSPRTPDRRGSIEHLADLTDQLAFADLRQVLALSRSADGLTPDRLLNLYRLGDQRSPWEELGEEKLHGVSAALCKRVVGQDQAVEHVATMILRAWLGLSGLQHSARRSKPKGTLFFVGPTGVGKTELAKACAEFLFGDESACIRFDMSEYNHEHSDQRLVGAPPGYVGFEAGGQLTNAVAARPFCVLLFDEIEKAHGRVLDKFLQILEDGRLTDGRGETAWFNEAVIIFTSNIGAKDAPNDESYETHFRREVEQHFIHTLGRPELLNRLGDNIVVFQSIADPEQRRAILGRKLDPLKDHLRERWGIKFHIEEPVLTHLLAAARLEHGGRGLLNAVERALMNPLARFLFTRHAKLRSGRVVTAQLDGDEIDFSLDDA